MTLNETIIRLKELGENLDRMAKDEERFGNKRYIHTKQQADTRLKLAKWLEELKELRKYKERMEMQYLDDINNPLEPLKLQSALESEIFKYNYRKEHKPKDISPLDYTIMYALKHCLEEQIKESTK